MKTQFYKYQATGNDFVIIDNRDNQYDRLGRHEISLICDRRFGVGGDGLIMLKNKEGYDFEMKYFNADGAVGSMCGNGSRCLVRFAISQGLQKDKFHFVAFDGEHFATVDNGVISVSMTPVNRVERINNATVLDTGSPHYVLPVEDIRSLDAVALGREIRNSPTYHEKGINVNFVEKKSDGELFVRTYERGVEDETLSCGTGVTAAAIAFAGSASGRYEFGIEARGGKLKVAYQKRGADFVDIWLTGPAEFVFSGQINI